MPADETILAAATTLLLGAGTTWWFVTLRLKRRLDARLHHAISAMRRQHDAVIDKMNASHDAARRELERLRNAPPRPVASAEQRVALARLEEQLSAAYAELDRLRLEVNGPAPTGRRTRPNGNGANVMAGKRLVSGSGQELTNGFAATMPFEV